MMKTLILLFVQLLSVIQGGDFSSNDVMSTLSKQLVLDVSHAIDPHQIIFIARKNINNVDLEADSIRTLVCRNFPTILIDFENIDVLNNTTKYESFRHTALFIVLCDQTSQTNLSDIERLQDQYVELFPRSPRPKWLILLTTEYADQTHEITLALKKSWENKFVDITIAQINSDLEDIVVHYYNPFKNESTRQYYGRDTTDIFPEKIRDMNGYSLSTIFYADPPGIHIIEAEIDDVPKISGIDYWVIETVSQVLNFTLEVYDSGEFNFTGLLDALGENLIDFSGNQIYFWNNEPFDKSTILKPDGYCVVVPIVQVPSARAKSRLYFGLLLTLFHIFIIINASKLLKFDRKIWTWINIFEIILGLPAPKLPGKVGERSLVGCIIVLSLTYTSVFYARMTDDQFKATEEAPLNNFMDLENSGLIPLVHTELYNITFDVFDNRSAVMKSLKRKARIWDDAISCVDEMSKNQTIACIMSEQLGNFLIDNYKDNEGMRTMRVMQPCFWITWRGYAFAPGSPYRERFDAIMSRIFESGFIKKWIDNKGLTSGPKKTLDLDTRFILEHMHNILKAGYLLSCLVFFVELMVYYFFT